ncbi:alcohol dehydrogenase, partial [Staphylococcus haemolyticus]|nr:alcohol dehydrogenase [Staphylococcus haemolyticus]
YYNMIRVIKLIIDVKSFRSEHHIAPQIELITADDIDNAYEKVLSSKVKYRFVIDISTM